MPVDPAELEIVHYPDPVLLKKAAEISTVDDETRIVADRMIELMHEAEGVGLAAPQVGLSWRMFVTAALDEEDDVDRVFINPEIAVVDRTAEPHEEGCLSLPGLTADIRRPRAVAISALDREGKSFTLESAAFPARVWQHEFDHLNGVLIINRMSPVDRLANRRIIKDMEAAAG